MAVTSQLQQRMVSCGMIWVFGEILFQFLAKDTIEERILDLQDKKAELLDVLSGEGGSILEMSKDELLALLD